MEIQFAQMQTFYLLPEYKSLLERSVYATYSNKRFLPIKLRKFIDPLADYLSNIDEDF